MATNASTIGWTDRACDQVMEERRGPDGALRELPEDRVREIFDLHRPKRSLFKHR